MRGRGADATLAAIATLTAAWPISTLLAEPSWLGGTLLLLVVVALSGFFARSLALRGWQVLVVQVVLTTLAASGMYGRGHLWHGLPSFETVGFAGDLLREALKTVQSYAAPAPTTPGLTFVVGCAMALIALSVDYLAVTRRSPSLAGLPLLIAFLAAAANSGSSLPAYFFIAAATMWLVLVARQGSAILRRWGTTVATPRTPVDVSLESEGTSSYASIARSLGVVALAAAVIMPLVLPQLPPQFLLSGLGRNPSGNGNGTGTVGFSLSLDLAADLRSTNTAPVLEYTTADTSPPPLRVTVSSFYDSERGEWVPRRGRAPTLSDNPDIPQPSGLAENVPAKRYTMTFGRNLLEEPNLAAPYPLVGADLDDIPWGLDNQTQDLRVGSKPDSYSVTYLALAPTAGMLANTTPGAGYPGNGTDTDFVLDSRSSKTIMTLSERLTADKASAYGKAMAIQQYLRDSGGFTYSLTLAPATKDASGEDVDPLTNFLITKQGYCVQFATAMVMMARAAGIPARIAIGFLPGIRSSGVWTVTASDAHAWPELYLEGIGWTRFEPTPSRAAPPAYAVPPTSAGSPVGGRPADDETAGAPRVAPTKNLGDASEDTGGTAVTASGVTSLVRWLTRGWGLVLLGSLIGLLGSLLVPTAARWRRRRDLMTARTSAQRVEVEWDFLTSSLKDLGIAPSPSRTPRQLRAYYNREAFLDGEASEALGRVVQTLEGSRYGVTAPVPEHLAADSRRVVLAAATTRRRVDRVRAALWPSTGLAQLRSARAQLVWSIRAPLRDARYVVRQWFSRRR